MKKFLIAIAVLLFFGSVACNKPSKPIMETAKPKDSLESFSALPSISADLPTASADIGANTSSEAPSPTAVPLQAPVYSERIDEIQVERIVRLLAAYHAAQMIGEADAQMLKLSEQVVSDLERRQECITEMERRIGAKFVKADYYVERLKIEFNGESYTVSFYEKTVVTYSSPNIGAVEPFGFGINHNVEIALDGTVLSDFFNEEYGTGFSNI